MRVATTVPSDLRSRALRQSTNPAIDLAEQSPMGTPYPTPFIRRAADVSLHASPIRERARRSSSARLATTLRQARRADTQVRDVEVLQQLRDALPNVWHLVEMGVDAQVLGHAEPRR